MNQRPQIETDSEETLTPPFFGQLATRMARPVIPLADSSSDKGRTVEPPLSFTSKKIWSWTLFLILLASAIGGMLGSMGARFYHNENRSIVKETPAPIVQTAVAPHPPAPSPSITPFESNPKPAYSDVEIHEGGEPKEIKTQPQIKSPAHVIAQTADKRVSSPKQIKENRAEHERESIPKRDEKHAARMREIEVKSESKIVEQRPRRAETIRQRTTHEDSADTDSDNPGPRRIDRIRDIFTGPEPFQETRRRVGRSQSRNPIQVIFEGNGPRR